MENKISFILDVTFLSIGSSALDIQGLRIRKGQKIKLQIRNMPKGGTAVEKPVWYANNDQVLEIVDNGSSAIITATAVGSSEVVIKLGNKVIRRILIEVTQPVATAVRFKVVITNK